MRCAILGDIHSNWEALSAVVAHAKKSNVDGFFSVGDIVGYGPDPERCMELLQSLSYTAVAGNHDQAVAGLIDFSYYSEGAREGILWTQENISHAAREKLKALPLTFQSEDFCLVHASLEQPGQWDYILDNRHALSSIRHQKQQICFYGHTHLPVIFRDDGNTIILREGTVKLVKEHRYMINAGSVGQPRDGNPQSCLLIYDSDTLTVEMCRVEYPFTKTQEKILQEGLPASLALRLSYGR